MWSLYLLEAEHLGLVGLEKRGEEILVGGLQVTDWGIQQALQRNMPPIHSTKEIHEEDQVGEKCTLTFVFDNERAKELFALWLCDGAGEQQYWEWMEGFEEEEEGPISVVNFGYHGPEDEQYSKNDRRRYKGFLYDNTIRCECGRLTDD